MWFLPSTANEKIQGRNLWSASHSTWPTVNTIDTSAVYYYFSNIITVSKAGNSSLDQSVKEDCVNSALGIESIRLPL